MLLVRHYFATSSRGGRGHAQCAHTLSEEEVGLSTKKVVSEMNDEPALDYRGYNALGYVRGYVIIFCLL